MKKAVAVMALLLVLAACGGKEEVASKENICVDSTQVEMFDEKGRVYYVKMSCDSLASLTREMEKYQKDEN